MRHRLIGEDEGVGCLTCGAYFDTDAEADASDCSGDTRQVHGYPGERVCWHGAHGSVLISEAAGERCEHMRGDCVCRFCD